MDSIGIKIRNATISDIEGMATVFDAYRVFNGKTTNISLAKKFLNDRIVSEESTILMARIKMKGAPVSSNFTSLSHLRMHLEFWF